uniref:Sugar phosphate isomerase/epimerase n=1 Tax=Schlesneria paludicola TaxID=360056 RepID=A0A7C4LNV6_9PLAN
MKLLEIAVGAATPWLMAPVLVFTATAGMFAIQFPWLYAQELTSRAAETGVFRRENLVAWCIVPFDARRRGPAERVAMLQRLGFRKYAYDWRAEHLPTFDEEVRLLKEHGIELTAVWFPTELNQDARTLLSVLERHGVKTQLWVTGGGGPTTTPEERQQRVQAEARRIRPIAEAAARLGCRVALYNHGGWFGEPENQLAILEELRLPNVGLVYNLHHGHDHLERFSQLLALMRPHLLALNLNGMFPRGDQIGQKIVPVGAGSEDLALLKAIRDSGYTGPMGILGHTNDDAEERLRDNLEGLDWLLRQLAGRPAEPLPKFRTYSPPPAPLLPPGRMGLVPGKFGQPLEARPRGVSLPPHPALRDPLRS